MSQKSEAKKREKYARMKAAAGRQCIDEGCDNAHIEHECIQVPSVLKQGQPGAGKWDIYLDGIRQRLCCYVDAKQGYVTRYTHGDGSTPLTKQTERVYGHVEILPKGVKSSHSDEQVIKSSAMNDSVVIVNPQTASELRYAGIDTPAVHIVDRPLPTARTGRRRGMGLSGILAAAVAVLGVDDGKNR